MFFRVSFCIATAVMVQTAHAETIGAKEFDERFSGKTVAYAQNGQAFGVEQYLKNRRVVWAFADEECALGYWYGVKDEICFVYDDASNPQCWTFTKTGEEITAVITGADPSTALTVVGVSETPMQCAFPGIGV